MLMQGLQETSGAATTIAGAVVFALHAKDLSIAKRLTYMLISMLVGYLADSEVRYWTGIQGAAVAAFIASAFVVTGALAGIDWLRKFDFSTLWPRR